MSNYSSEIISHEPGWLSRSGSAAVLIIIIMLITLSMIIRNPEVISSTVIVSSTAKPILISSRSDGQLIINNNIDGNKVKAGQVLGYIQNQIDTSAINSLKKLISTLNENKSENISLENFGHIETLFSELTIARERDQQYQHVNGEAVKIKMLSDVLVVKQQLLKTQELVLENKQRALKLTEASLQRDSALYDERVISEVDFQATMRKYYEEQANYQFEVKAKQNLVLEIQTLKSDLEQTKLLIASTTIRNKQDIRTKKTIIEEEIKKWEYRSLIVAPISGTLYFHKILGKNQEIIDQEELFYVVPHDSRNFAYSHVNDAGFGKVEVDQRVLIKLDDFPYVEYGHIEGKVSKISPIFTEKGYLVTISLPDELISNQKKKLEFMHEMRGTSEIITRDVSLFERIIFSLSLLNQG